MVAIQTVLKIALNTDHMKHPFCSGESKSNRYSNWQKKGILAFAIASIFSLGIASCFLIVTASLKQKKLNRNNIPTAKNTQEVAIKSGAFNHVIKGVDADIKLAIESFLASHTTTISMGILLIQVENSNGEVRKHHQFALSDSKKMLEYNPANQIDEISSGVIKRLEPFFEERFTLDWSILLKGDNNFFGEIHGRLENGQNCKINARGHSKTSSPKKDFEEILKKFNLPQKLLEPFDLRGDSSDLTGLEFYQ